MPYKDLAFVVPFKTDNGRREQIFHWNINRLKSLFPGAQICIGEQKSDGPWNLAEARNNGIKNVDREFLFSVDADTVWNAEVVIDSVISLYNNKWVIPYVVYCNLDEASGKKLIQDEPDTVLIHSNYDYERELRNPPESDPYPPVSGLLAMRTEDMYTVGGYDERSKGWGWEDRMFAYAAEKILGCRPTRLNHYIYHIWHPVGDTTTQPHYHENWDLFRRYEQDFDSIYQKFL